MIAFQEMIEQPIRLRSGQAPTLIYTARGLFNTFCGHDRAVLGKNPR
jgi:hypothetical protein